MSGRGSGRRGPELRDAEYLIDGERDDAKHEVAFDLDRAAHADDPCAEFVLQSGVDAFGHGSKIEEPVVGVGHVDEFHALDFFGPNRLDAESIAPRKATISLAAFDRPLLPNFAGRPAQEMELRDVDKFRKCTPIFLIDSEICCADRRSDPTPNNIHRLRGEILLKRDFTDLAPAEEAFETSIAVAKQQGSLRAGRDGRHAGGG